ncbi:MAG TPA: hypothetical protein VI259_07350 [Gemmatimonadaceae bacterium]
MTNTHLRRRYLPLAFVLMTMALSAHDAVAQGNTVTLLDYKATVPASWVSRTPSSTSRLAQFMAPGPDSAEIVVFFFGASMGGNVDANLARWRGQFSNGDTKPASERVTRDSSGTFPLTIAEYSGTYRRGIGMGSADSVRTGQTLIATIVETPRGAMFIQLFGPTARVAAERDTFLKFVKGIGSR